MKILEGFLWGVVMLVVLVIGAKAGEIHAKKAEAAAYQQGYKDALYKRPVSNDLEMVCAGLWVGQENAKYQKRDK
jgi:septation ring formation regulator EzrA